MKGLPDETHYIQAAYFHMRQILGTWRRELLFNPSAQPSPITAPQIISSRVFAFSPTKTLLADFKKSWTKKGKNEKNEKEEAVREIIDCTPVTNSIPLVYSYLIPSVHGNSCEVVRIEGNAVRTSKNSFVIYLKDGRPCFKTSCSELLNSEKFNISSPELVMSSQEKDVRNRRIMREAKRKEVIKVKARK